MDNKIWEILNRSLETFTQNIIDQYVEANVSFRSRSGVKAVIIRRELGRCCDWCRSLAGIYDYENAPQNVYARHDNCKCLVTFKNEKGYTDVWSKIDYKTQREARKARLEWQQQNQSYIDSISYKKRIAKAEGKFCADITNEFLNIKYPDQGFSYADFIKIGNERYYVSGRSVVHDHKPGEIKVAERIHEIIGGILEILPRVNSPEGIKSADYVINGEKWDLKQPTGNSKNTVKGNLYQAKGQAFNVVLDISECGLSVPDVIDYINDAYSYGYMDFLQKVILFKDNEIINVFERI